MCFRQVLAHILYTEDTNTKINGCKKQSKKSGIHKICESRIFLTGTSQYCSGYMIYMNSVFRFFVYQTPRMFGYHKHKINTVLGNNILIFLDIMHRGCSIKFFKGFAKIKTVRKAHRIGGFTDIIISA